MNTKKVWLSVAASAILATGLGAANYYLPLGDSSPSDDNGSMWHLVGVPGFAGTNSGTGFNAWSAVTDLGNDDYSTAGGKDQSGNNNMIRVKAIDEVENSSGTNIEFQQVELRVNSQVFPWDDTSPWYITYVDADGNGIPDVRVDYHAFLDGATIELQYKDSGGTLSSVLVSQLNANSTFDNPATAVTKTATTGASSATILDVIDMDLTNNPGYGIGEDTNTTDLFDKDEHLDVLTSSNGRARVYEYDPIEMNWNLYDSANEKGNDFTELKAGQGYWIRLDRKNSATSAGLVLATSALDSNNYMPGSQFVANGIGTNNGWNLMSFGDEPIRYSMTGLMVDVNTTADSNLSRVLVIEDAYRTNEVSVALNNNAYTLAEMARKINFSIERAKRDYTIVGDNFNVRAFPSYGDLTSAADDRIVFLSDKQFTIYERGTIDKNATVDFNMSGGPTAAANGAPFMLTDANISNYDYNASLAGQVNAVYGILPNASYGFDFTNQTDINGSGKIQLWTKQTIDGNDIDTKIAEADVIAEDINNTIGALMGGLDTQSKWNFCDINDSGVNAWDASNPGGCWSSKATGDINITAKPFWGSSLNTIRLTLKTTGTARMGGDDCNATEIFFTGAGDTTYGGPVASGALTVTHNCATGGTLGINGSATYGTDQNWTILFGKEWDQLDTLELRLLSAFSGAANTGTLNGTADTGVGGGATLTAVPELIVDDAPSTSAVFERIDDAIALHPIYSKLVKAISGSYVRYGDFNTTYQYLTFTNAGWDGYIDSNKNATTDTRDGVGIEINASLSSVADVNSSDDLFTTVRSLDTSGDADFAPIIINATSDSGKPSSSATFDLNTTYAGSGGGATSRYGLFALAVKPNLDDTNSSLYSIGLNRGTMYVNGTAVTITEQAAYSNGAYDFTNSATGTYPASSASAAYNGGVITEFSVDLDFNATDDTVILVGDKRFTVQDKTFMRVYKYDAPNAASRILVQSGNDQDFVSVAASATAATVATALDGVSSIDAVNYTDGTYNYIIVANEASVNFDIKEDVTNGSTTTYSPGGSMLTEVYNDSNVTSKGSFVQAYQIHRLAKGAIEVAMNDYAFSPSADWDEGKVTLSAFVDDLKSNEVWTDDFPTDGTLYTLKDTTTVNKKPRAFVTGATNTDTYGDIEWQLVDVTRPAKDWYDVDDNYNLFWTEKERGYWVYLDTPVTNPISIASATFEPTMTTHYNNDVPIRSGSTNTKAADPGVVANLLRGTLTVSVSGLLDTTDFNNYKGSSAVVYALVGGEKVYLTPQTETTFTATLTNFELASFNDAQNINGITVVASNGQGDVVTTDVELNYVKPTKPTIAWTNGAVATLSTTDTTIDQYKMWTKNISEENPTLNSYTFTQAEGTAGFNVCQNYTWSDSNYSTLRVAAQTLVLASGTVYNTSDMAVSDYAPVFQASHVLQAAPGSTDSNPYNYNSDCTADALLTGGANSGVQFQTLSGSGSTMALAYQPIKDSGTGNYLELSSGTPKTMFVSLPTDGTTAVAKIDYLLPYADYGTSSTQKRFYLYSGTQMYTGLFQAPESDGDEPYSLQTNPYELEKVETSQTLVKGEGGN